MFASVCLKVTKALQDITNGTILHNATNCDRLGPHTARVGVASQLKCDYLHNCCHFPAVTVRCMGPLYHFVVS